ncbi:hypothetical protein HDV00_006548 [Rhizophlyctis rosea]|nr:hypothetical protein HDV00_006548 [Rhizophlyctis rosea]
MEVVETTVSTNINGKQVLILRAFRAKRLQFPLEIFSYIAQRCDPLTARALRSTSRVLKGAVTPDDLVTSEARWRLSKPALKEYEALLDCWTWAIKNHHFDIIRRQTPYIQQADIQPLLILGAQIGLIEFVETAIKAGATVNTGRPRPLYLASQNKHHEVVKTLLKAGAHANNNQSSALCVAATNGYTEIVDTFLTAGARANAQNSAALRNAAKHNHAKVVGSLLFAGANPNARESVALRMAARHGYTSVVELLLNAGADPRPRKWAAMRTAARNGHVQIMRMMNTFWPGGFGLVYFVGVVNAGYVEIVQLLLKYRIIPQEKLDVSLRHAAERGYTTLVKILLDANANPNASIHPKRVPAPTPNPTLISHVREAYRLALHRLHSSPTLTELTFFLLCGGDKHRSRSARNEFLSHLATEGPIEIIELFLVMGVDGYVMDHASGIAERGGRGEVVRVLRSAGARRGEGQVCGEVSNQKGDENTAEGHWINPRPDGGDITFGLLVVEMMIAFGIGYAIIRIIIMGMGSLYHLRNA